MPSYLSELESGYLSQQFEQKGV